MLAAKVWKVAQESSLVAPGAKWPLRRIVDAVGLDGGAERVQAVSAKKKMVAALDLKVLELDPDILRILEIENDEDAHAAKVFRAARAYLGAADSGKIGYTLREAAEDEGLDTAAAPGQYSGDVQAVQKMVVEMDKEKVDGEDEDGGAGEDDEDGDNEGDGGGAGAAGLGTDVGGGRRGRSGRRPKADTDVPAAREYGSHGVSHEDYANLVQGCAFQIAEQPGGKRWKLAGELSNEMEDRYGCIVGQRTLFNHSKEPGAKASFPGGQYFSDDFEQGIAEVVKYFRTRKMPIFKSDVIAWVHAELVDQGKEHLVEDLTDGWYRGWLRRTGCCTGTVCPIETTRAAWFTPDNLEQWYDIVAEMLVEAGIARRNEHFDRDKPYDEMLTIDHIERVVSYDETDATLDETAKVKSNINRIVKSGRDDDGAVSATKSSIKITAVGGRIGKRALVIYVVFGTGEKRDPEWSGEAPEGNAVSVTDQITDSEGNVTDVEVFGYYTSNEKGSMTQHKCLDYLRKVILPSVRKEFPGLKCEPGSRAVEFCDGVGVHLKYDRLKEAKEAGLECCVRIPHTSDETQAGGLLRTRPTLNLLLLLRRGGIENKHSTDVESPPPPSHVGVSIHPEGKSRSNLASSART